MLPVDRYLTQSLLIVGFRQTQRTVVQFPMIEMYEIRPALFQGCVVFDQCGMPFLRCGTVLRGKERPSEQCLYVIGKGGELGSIAWSHQMLGFGVDGRDGVTQYVVTYVR